jgi:PAS domain S-box-containing protein
MDRSRKMPDGKRNIVNSGLPDENHLLLAYAEEINAIDDRDALIRSTANWLLKHCHPFRVTINSYDPEANVMRVFSVESQETKGRFFNIKVMPEDLAIIPMKEFQTRRIFEADNENLVRFLSGKIDPGYFDRLSANQRSGKFYSIGLFGRDDVIGSVNLFYPQNEAIQQAGLVESVVGVASVAMRRFYAEEKREQSEELYRKLVETSPDGILMMDLAGRMLMLNQRLLSILGYDSVEDLREHSSLIFDYIVPEEREYAKNNFRARLTRNFSLNQSYSVLRKDGSVIVIEVRTSVITGIDGQPESMFGILRDITEEKLAMERIQRSEELYRAILRTAMAGISIHDKEGKILLINEQAMKSLGIRKEKDILGKRMYEFMGEQGRLMHREIMQVAEGSSELEFESSIQVHGVLQWFHVNIRKITHTDGRFIGVQVMTRDITERKKGLAKLEQLSKAVHHSPASVEITNLDGTIEYVNPKFCRTSGYSEKELIGKKPSILKSGYTPRTEYRTMWRTILAGKEWRGVFKNKRKNGTSYFELVHISPIFDEQRMITHFIAVKEDMTERMEAEEKVRKYTEQLRALSHHHDKIREEERKALAREIHDMVGVSISGIKMHLQVLRQSMQDTCGQQEDLEAQIQDLMDTAGNTIVAMRRLIRGLRPGILDELGFIEAVRWYSSEIQARSELKFRISIVPDEISVPAEKAIVLFRIFQELINNILVHARASRVIVRIHKENRHLFMSVKDNGIGIRKKDLEKRTSFGILGIRERMILLKGKVSFSGTPSQGTVVSIELPMR